MNPPHLIPAVEIVLGKMSNQQKAEKAKSIYRSVHRIPVQIKKEMVGEKGKLLTENLEVTLSFYNDGPIAIDLPNQVQCKIETTDAALKGQTVSSSYKPAVLDNGLNIQVPPFIEKGDVIILDTRTLEYIKKI